MSRTMQIKDIITYHFKATKYAIRKEIEKKPDSKKVHYHSPLYSYVLIFAVVILV